MDFDDLHDLADDRPNDRPELSSPTVLHLSYLLELVHDGSLSHLEISDWLVYCLRYDLC